MKAEKSQHERQNSQGHTPKADSGAVAESSREERTEGRIRKKWRDLRKEAKKLVHPGSMWPTPIKPKADEGPLRQ